MLGRLEGQIERFAPGFRECVLSRRVFSPKAMEAMDENLIGGDIVGGAVDLRQTLCRPTWRRYATPDSTVYILLIVYTAGRRRTWNVRFSCRPNCGIKVSGKRPISKRMEVMSTALGGMRTAQNTLEKTAERIAGAATQRSDSVDLSTEMVEMLAAANQYQANARVIQNTDTMQKKLLDILA